MKTIEKKNGRTLEEIRLNDPTIKTFAIRTDDEKSNEKLAGILMAVGGKSGGRALGNGDSLTLASRDVVLALRKYNETHKDKVQYEVL
jgi:hypothetical protein